jgi:hypothetical protein
MLTIPGAQCMLVSVRKQAATAAVAAAMVAASGSAVAAAAEERRAEVKSAGQATIHAFAAPLATLAQSGSSSSVKTKAIIAIKQVP